MSVAESRMYLIQSELIVSKPDKHVPIDKFQNVIHLLLTGSLLIFLPFLFSQMQQTLPNTKPKLLNDSWLILHDMLEILVIETWKIIIVLQKEVREPNSASSFLILINHHVWMMLLLVVYHIQKLLWVAWQLLLLRLLWASGCWCCRFLLRHDALHSLFEECSSLLPGVREHLIKLQLKILLILNMVIIRPLFIAFNLFLDLAANSLDVICWLTAVIVVLASVESLSFANSSTFMFLMLRRIHETLNLFLLFSFK